jgi:hypothetical protein
MAEALTQNNIAEEFIKNMNKLDEKRWTFRVLTIFGIIASFL